MSIEVMQWVWDHSKSRNGGRLVLLAIADSCNSPDGSGAWPSMAELQRKTGLSGRAVNSATEQLVKLGELRVLLNAGPKGCNRYTVVMTPAESAPPQILRGTPAESAGGTVIEPLVEVVTTSSASGALFETEATTKTTRKRKARAAVAPRFDEFWKAYPKRKDVGDAEAAWTKAVEAGADVALMIDAARLYAMERKGQDPKWTKLPTTWLNKRCWQDEPDLDYSPPAGATANGAHQAWRNPTDINDYYGPI